MIEIKKIMTYRDEIKSKTCDVCGKTTDNPAFTEGKDFLNNDFEEFISFSVNPGYNAKFLKDGMRMSFDICEECFCKKMLPQFKNVTFHTSFNHSEEDIKNMTIDDI